VTGLPEDTEAFRGWLEHEARRLLDFAVASRHPGGGFGWLDDGGRLDESRPVQTWVTSRMTYVFALAHLRGDDDAAALVDHGVTALRTLLHDDEHGGWLASDPRVEVIDEKRAYDHAFVVLAAATATVAGRPGAAELLADALRVVEQRFWEEEAGLCLDVWDRGWSAQEPYRGANANMHMTEAFLAASEATGDVIWRDRALGIAERLVHGEARRNVWRLPEHFDAGWRVVLEYNHDDPAHPFRPYGATVGHWFEWARLLGHLHLAVPNPPAWLLADARSLFEAGALEGWAVDGADGIVYTVGFDGAPVVRERMHWVVTEAIGAAALLGGVTPDPVLHEWQRTWWQYAVRYLIDDVGGSWHHELDPTNVPGRTVWQGKPDVYHAYQAVLLCLTPPGASLVGALAALGR